MHAASAKEGTVIARFGVCYVASDGYLFQTIVSALQAKEFVSPDVAVFIVHIGGGETAEAKLFRDIATSRGVEFITADQTVLNGLHPMYARLFLDEFLPDGVDELLYLDGDTQVAGDLTPLLMTPTPAKGVLGVRDPMVFIREVDAKIGAKIDRWWDGSGIPDRIRPDYLNSGVLRISRSDLPGLRAECLAMVERGDTARFQFHDQDAINLAVDGRVGTLSLEWNFPGFLLGTPMEEENTPRVVHFMSNPRPWNAPFQPWGSRYYQAYADFVSDHPETESYWDRMRGVRRVRYTLQQALKQLTERRTWNSSAATLAARRHMAGSIQPL